MTYFKTLLAAACLLAFPAYAQNGVQINDAYARAAAASGAIFLTITNHQSEDDRLISATADAAKVTELHTHIAGADGVMKMRAVEDGFVIRAMGDHALKRGGDHIMLMGLTQPLKEGDEIEITLTFEKAGEVKLKAKVGGVAAGTN